MASTLLGALGIPGFSTGNLDPTTLSALSNAIGGLGQVAGVNAQQAGTRELNTMTDLGLQNSSMTAPNVAFAEEAAALAPQQMRAQDLLQLLGIENQANALSAQQSGELASLLGQQQAQQTASTGGGAQNVPNDPNAFTTG